MAHCDTSTPLVSPSPSSLSSSPPHEKSRNGGESGSAYETTGLEHWGTCGHPQLLVGEDFAPSLYGGKSAVAAEVMGEAGKEEERLRGRWWEGRSLPSCSASRTPSAPTSFAGGGRGRRGGGP